MSERGGDVSISMSTLRWLRRPAVASVVVCLAQATWAQAAEPSFDLGTRIAEFLAERSAEPIGRIDLPPLASSSLEAAQPGVSVQLSLATGHTAPGTNAVGITLVRGERTLRRAVVNARAFVLRDAIIATRALRSGETLAEADVALEQRVLDTPRGDALEHAEDAIGRRVRRHVRAGEPLAAAWLDEAPRVKRGDRVTLRLARGGLRIETTGRAEQDGALGAWIRVRNVASKREVLGRVAGPGVVDVEI